MNNEERLERLTARIAQQENTIKQLQEQLSNLTEAGGVSNWNISYYPDYEEDEYPNTREGVMQNIMDNFDFKRVADMCQFIGWEIQDEDEGVNVRWLKQVAENEIHAAWKAFNSGEADEEWIVHTGPLKLWWCENDEGIFAELQFVAEEWCVEP